MRAFLARLRDAFRRRNLAEEFEEERQFHVAALEQRHRERGASPEEARQAAAREFGNAVRTREELRAQAGFPAWDELANDFRHALRGVIRRPWLAGSVFAILTLGLGATATIHGLVDAVFLRPLPVPHPEELYAATPPPKFQNRLSRGTARRLEAALPAGSVAAYGGGTRATVQIGSQPATRVSVRLVNGSFFSALEVLPSAGRLLAGSDDVPGAPTDVAVLSHPWAVKTFGTPEAALGREVFINRVPIAVIGVLPARFREVAVGQQTDFWLATALQPRLQLNGNSSSSTGDDRPNDPDWNREERVSWLQVLVRVRAGTPPPVPALERAWESQRDDLLLTHDDPQEREELKHETWQLVPAPGGLSRFRDSFRSTASLLSSVVAVMLVLVCANVSGILLVRAMSRHREIGVRLSLGAGSIRVMRLGFFETLILSLAGAVGGALLAAWLLPAAVHLLAPGQDIDVSLGGRTLAVMAGLAMFTAVLSALAPALWISRVQPLSALSGNRGLGRAPIRLGRILVVAQFALAVALVAVAAALGAELQRLLTADPGFERARVLTALFDATNAGYDQKAIPALQERLRAAALTLPGAQSVGFAASGILAGSESISGIYVRDPKARVQRGSYQHDGLSPGYFGVVGMTLLRGREFTDGDNADAPAVAVISAAFAQEVFGDLDPIGQVIGFDTKPSKDDRTIIGVVTDVRMNSVRAKTPPMFYTPLAQQLDPVPYFLAFRYTGAEAAVQTGLQAALARVDPGLVFASWRTLQGRMEEDLKGDLATTRLAEIFGGCAILLAGAGIAGSLGYLVVLRQRELALRMAVGASPGHVLRGVLKDSLRLSLIGTAFGVTAAWLLPMLPVVRAVLSSPPGLVPALLAALIAVLTAVVAGFIPARRASRIDPILMLKSE